MVELEKKIELEFQQSVATQNDVLLKDIEEKRIEEEGNHTLRKKGRPLSYIAPQLKQGGTPTAQLQFSKIENEGRKWKNAVIFYVIGETPTISYLTTYLQKQCELVGWFDIFYHNEGYFIIRFEHGVDRDKLLFEGLYMIASRPTIVNEWVAGFCFEKEVLKEIPLWIRLPKLPLSCWSDDYLSRIGSVIGKPICSDDCTSQQTRISYARLLVEVDITQPLRYKINIEDDNGGVKEQHVYYEWVPRFCQKCHEVGHICADKMDKKMVPRLPIQKQQWQVKEKSIVVPTEKDPKGKCQEKREWEVTKKTASTTIQVGQVHIPTDNGFEKLETGVMFEEAGTLSPLEIHEDTCVECERL